MDNPLLKYNAKEYFFKASLCHFIVDELNAKVTQQTTTIGSHWVRTDTFVGRVSCLIVHCRNQFTRTLSTNACVFQLAIEKYEEMFPAFSDSRELKLLKVNYLFLFFQRNFLSLHKYFIKGFNGL